MTCVAAPRSAIAMLVAVCLVFQGCATSFQSVEVDSSTEPDALATAVSSLQAGQLVRIATIDDRFEATFFGLEGHQLIVRDKVYPFGGKYAPDRERYVYDLEEIQTIEVAAGKRLGKRRALLLGPLVVVAAVFVGLAVGLRREN